jgi:hypothetical protein
VSNNLLPVDAPDLQPLRNSFEYDQLESELKDAFLAVYDQYIRPFERQVNLSGMPHLGDTDLIERTLKDYGLAIVRRDATRTAFLLKAARARNPRRGMLFLKQYLQSVWPGVWKVETLWHPMATAADYPQDATPLTSVQLDPTTVAVFKTDTGEDLPDVFRTDYQGRMPLYPTPRTNALRQSGNLADNAYWSGGGTGYAGPKATSTAIPAPDGTGKTVTKITVASSTAPLFVRQSGLTLNAGPCAASLWIYVPSGQGVTDVTLYADYNDADTGSGFTVTALDQWVRVTSVATLTAARTWCDWNIKGNGGTAGLPVNTVFYVDMAQCEPGATATRYIATTTAPVTYTDFTVDANGMATFADGITPPAPLVYFRTGRIRITLPVSVDNGLGLIEIAKAFRSTLAARLMLELQLSTVFESLGSASGGLSLAGGAIGSMPVLASGTLTR